LFNRYQALDDLDDDNPTDQNILEKYIVKDSEFSNQDSGSLNKVNNNKHLSKFKYLKLLPSFEVTSVDMDVGVGNWRRRKKLEKLKSTQEGQTVQQIETELSEFNVESAEAVRTSSNLRNFDQSKNMISQRKFQDKICTKDTSPRNKIRIK
jgi:hypothetical protein